MAAKQTEKARKDSIHPNFRMIEVVDTKGNKFNIASAYSQDVLKLDIDTSTHPAWTKELNYVNKDAGKVAQFNKKFSGLSFSSKK